MSKPRENKAETAAPKYSRTLKRLPLTVVQDTRERYTPTFSEGVQLTRAKLEYADYSAVGLTDRVALELKWSLSDLVACVTFERERFETMLAGLAQYPVRALIVAASEADLLMHRYRSEVEPRTVVSSLWAWQQDHRIPVVFAGGILEAAAAVEWWLRRAQRKAAKEGKAA